jgi:hypothetical protein
MLDVTRCRVDLAANAESLGAIVHGATDRASLERLLDSAGAAGYGKTQNGSR